MKKVLAMACACCMLWLCACGAPLPANVETPTSAGEIVFRGDICPPKDVRLLKSLKIMGLTYDNPGKRYAYYSLAPLPGGLLPPEVCDAYYEERYGKEPEPTEMPLAALLEEYKISKTAFEAACQQMAEELQGEDLSGYELTNEIYEIPNPDVIYTFDHDVINAYYRRINPVDFNSTEAATATSAAGVLGLRP